MSGSPKYASVELSAARRAMIAQERARRAEARRQRGIERHREAQARAARRQADRAAATERRQAEREAAAAAHVDRGRRVQALQQQVGAVEDRRVHDPAGAREVDRLVQDVRGAVGDERRFARAEAALTNRLDQHVAEVESGRETRERAEVTAAEAVAALDDLLAEADDAAVAVPGREELEALRQRVRSDLDTGHHEAAISDSVRITERLGELEEAVEEGIAAARSAEMIFEAATEALPEVGFRLVPSSVVGSGAGIAFTVERTDGSVLDMSIEQGADGTRLRYEGAGRDYVLRREEEGQVARCDVTADLLDTLHEGLEAHGVEVGELTWDRMPRRRPTRRRARGRAMTTRSLRERQVD